MKGKKKQAKFKNGNGTQQNMEIGKLLTTDDELGNK